MDSIYKLKDLLEKEIDKVTAKGDITPVELKSVGDAVDILKDIETICAMKEYGNDDQSYAMSNRGYSSRRMSRDNYRDKYNDYLRGHDTYSRHSEKEEMIDKLERMMRNSDSEQERRDIADFIARFEKD